MWDESHAAEALPSDVDYHVCQIPYGDHIGLEVGELVVVVVQSHGRVDKGEAFHLAVRQVVVEDVRLVCAEAVVDDC